MFQNMFKKTLFETMFFLKKVFFPTAMPLTSPEKVVAEGAEGNFWGSANFFLEKKQKKTLKKQT